VLIKFDELFNISLYVEGEIREIGKIKKRARPKTM